MEDREQRKPDGWSFPPDMAAALAPILFTMIFVVAACGIPWTAAATLFRLAIVLGSIGTALLFVARLPLYRQARFFSAGPKVLHGVYRKLYFLAYGLIVPSILSLALALLFLIR